MTNGTPVYPIEPVLGIQRFAAIRVSFPDENFTVSQELLSQRIDLLSDYFSNVSYGRVSIDVTFDKEVCKLSKNSTYYSDILLEGPKQMELVNESLLSASASMNLTGFMRFIIFCAGEDISIHPNATGFWPFAYFVPQVFGYRTAPIIGYVCVVTESSPLGVLAHEVAHTFGLPDLYNISVRDRAYESDNLVGAWFLMGTGNLNPSDLGTIPAQPSAWEKIQLGWLNDSQVACPLPSTQTIVRLKAIETGIGVVALRIGLGGTWLMGEFKEKIGYDSGLPYDGGLVLYYVDGSKTSGGGIIRVVGGVYGYHFSGLTLRVPADRVSYSEETVFIDKSLNVSIVPLVEYNNTIVLLVGPEYVGLLATNASKALRDAIEFRDSLRISISERTGTTPKFNETDAVIEEGWRKYSEGDFSGAQEIALHALMTARAEYERIMLWLRINGLIILAVLFGISTGLVFILVRFMRFVYGNAKRLVEA